MVAPRDIGTHAAELLTGPVQPTRVVHIEGPRRYTPTDVARALAAALGRPVEVASAPEAEWVPTLERLGFSPKAARSMAAMTRATASGQVERPRDPVRGPTTLEAYVEALIAR